MKRERERLTAKIKTIPHILLLFTYTGGPQFTMGLDSWKTHCKLKYHKSVVTKTFCNSTHTRTWWQVSLTPLICSVLFSSVAGEVESAEAVNAVYDCNFCEYVTYVLSCNQCVWFIYLQTESCHGLLFFPVCYSFCVFCLFTCLYCPFFSGLSENLCVCLCVCVDLPQIFKWWKYNILHIT